MEASDAIDVQLRLDEARKFQQQGEKQSQFDKEKSYAQQLLNEGIATQVLQAQVNRVSTSSKEATSLRIAKENLESIDARLEASTPLVARLNTML